MRTVRTKVYKFSELNETAKQKAIEKRRNDGDLYYFWDEHEASLLEFGKIFPINITNYSAGGRGEGVSFNFYSDHNIEELTGQRLATYIWNNYKSYLFKGKYYSKFRGEFRTPEFKNFIRRSKILLENDCVMTGCCTDENILGPVYRFLEKPTNDSFYDLIEDCFNEWIKGYNQEVNYRNSDECIEEDLIANEYEFTQDGKQF